MQKIDSIIIQIYNLNTNAFVLNFIIYLYI